MDHDNLGRSLKQTVHNGMRGVGLDADLPIGFDVRVPKARLGRERVGRPLGWGTGF